MKKIKYIIDIVVVAIFVVIMMNVPWEDLQGFPFQDYKRYVDYFLHQETIFEYINFSGFVDYIINEALWHYTILTLVRDLGVPIAIVFGGISAFCLAVFAFFLVKRCGPLSIILLINPLIVTFAFDQLRLALAYSLVLVGYMVRIRPVAILLTLIAMFIHTSIVLFVGIYFAVLFISKIMMRQAKFPTYLAFLFLGIAISIVIGPLRTIILSYLGDRRAHLGDAESSLLYTLFWVGLLGLFSLQSRSFFRDEVHGYAVVILSLVGANLLTGGYTLRFLSVGLPMILAAMLRMRIQTRLLALIAFAGYAIFQWSYWMGASLRV